MNQLGVHDLIPPLVDDFDAKLGLSSSSNSQPLAVCELSAAEFMEKEMVVEVTSKTAAAGWHCFGSTVNLGKSLRQHATLAQRVEEVSTQLTALKHETSTQLTALKHETSTKLKAQEDKANERFSALELESKLYRTVALRYVMSCTHNKLEDRFGGKPVAMAWSDYMKQLRQQHHVYFDQHGLNQACLDLLEKVFGTPYPRENPAAHRPPQDVVADAFTQAAVEEPLWHTLFAFIDNQQVRQAHMDANYN
ncbi:hypothetical protein CHLRE_09g391430v5 [Chlamydomonas reinhardtii]|uniref:Uncharacterized protein n=1 Tax=Chlamydomonas reinhardtii TaxID=3055 RepID=A0A2K3DE80_CHLRE|nr:uncharacterized protein CHLRE_09g391430v5 [Chlamydomonas reinhardtii]PNW78827.1 hypothetical protein CHLRE_09g391430v5 [Chlamydomonas reinhardtii]